MCGLLGEFTFGDHHITEITAFKNILTLSKHRGPDATEVLRNANFQLGFNRLAILDLSPNGNQPQSSPSGRYHIVFNGEIYNYKELRNAYHLENLKSTSDTEIVVHLIEKLGVVKSIPLLNGMFAIAIIDSHTDLLYLTRDFAGIKPLFYGISEVGMVFASQFDQVFKHIWFKKKLVLREESVKEFFALGYMQSPNTVYRSIYQVNPGEILEINQNGQIINTIATSFSHNQGEEKNSIELSEVLQEAVSRQMVSDVPIGCFLSGGIDSPLISAYAKKHSDSLEVFTLKVDLPRINESEIAKKYAIELSLNQNIISIKESDLLNGLDEHFQAFSEPFGDYSSIPTYIISGEAKKQFTVMLSGDGGDELFFGYPRMLDVLQKRLWFKMPYPLRTSLVRITNRLGITKTWAPFNDSLNDFILNKHVKLPEEILSLAFPKVHITTETKSLYKFENKTRTELLHQMRWNEFYAHLQRVLIKVDRASMAHSLEVRVPFLDKHVVDWAWKNKGKLDSQQAFKSELKSLLAKEVPQSLINQKKMGFTVPLHGWLRNELKSDLVKMVFEVPFYGDQFIKVDVLRSFVQDFLDEHHNNAWGVWHIYAWQKWAYLHVISE